MKDKNSQLDPRQWDSDDEEQALVVGLLIDLGFTFEDGNWHYGDRGFGNLESFMEVARESVRTYAATREAEGRKQGALKLWAKISVAVGLWLPAFNSKTEEAKAAKMLIKVMTKEKDDYLKALTDTQGEER